MKHNVSLPKCGKRIPTEQTVQIKCLCPRFNNEHFQCQKLMVDRLFDNGHNHPMVTNDGCDLMVVATYTIDMADE